MDYKNTLFPAAKQFRSETFMRMMSKWFRQDLLILTRMTNAWSRAWKRTRPCPRRECCKTSRRLKLELVVLNHTPSQEGFVSLTPLLLTNGLHPPQSSKRRKSVKNQEFVRVVVRNTLHDIWGKFSTLLRGGETDQTFFLVHCVRNDATTNQVNSVSLLPRILGFKRVPTFYGLGNVTILLTFLYTGVYSLDVYPGHFYTLVAPPVSGGNVLELYDQPKSQFCRNSLFSKKNTWPVLGQDAHTRCSARRQYGQPAPSSNVVRRPGVEQVMWRGSAGGDFWCKHEKMCFGWMYVQKLGLHSCVVSKSYDTYLSLLRSCIANATVE